MTLALSLLTGTSHGSRARLTQNMWTTFVTLFNARIGMTSYAMYVFGFITIYMLRFTNERRESNGTKTNPNSAVTHHKCTRGT